MQFTVFLAFQVSAYSPGAEQRLDCAYKVRFFFVFFYQSRGNYTDRMTPYGNLFTHNVFPLQAL